MPPSVLCEGLYRRARASAAAAFRLQPPTWRDALLAHVDVDGVVDKRRLERAGRGLGNAVGWHVVFRRLVCAREGQVRYDRGDIVAVVALDVLPTLRGLLHERSRRFARGGGDARDDFAGLLGGDELPDSVGCDDDEAVAVGVRRGRRGRAELKLLDVGVRNHAVLFALAIADRARHGEADLSVGPHARRARARRGRDRAARRHDAGRLDWVVRLAVLGQVLGDNLAALGGAHHRARVDDDGGAATRACEAAAVARENLRGGRGARREAAWPEGGRGIGAGSARHSRRPLCRARCA
eukprot:scaffold64659_cov23-Tisochrysis_lutea.AAC.2